MKSSGGRFCLRSLFAAVVAMSAWTGAGDALAHPHVWIDARATFQLDSQARIRAIHIEWRFDEFFSAFAIEELAPDGEDGITEDQRAQLARQYADNLVEWHYMTELAVDDGYAVLGEAEKYSTEIENGIVTFVFTLPVVEPVDPKAHAIGLRMYDPTYYISIEYAGETPLAIEGDAGHDCIVSVDEARPEMETVPLSGTSFTSTDRATGIGFLFAETGRLNCE